MITSLPRWIVRRSGFPFTTPGAQIGLVVADDKAKAEKLARQVFGMECVCERETDPADLDPYPYRDPKRDQAAALTAAPTAMRIMTPMEVQLARALGLLRISGPVKGTVRRLHAESFKPTPEISDQLAAKLRQIAHQHRGQLSPELLESAGDLSSRGAA